MLGSVQQRMITSAPRSLAAPTRCQRCRRPYLRRNSRFDVLFSHCNDSKSATDHTSCTVCGVRAPAFGATQLAVRCGARPPHQSSILVPVSEVKGASRPRDSLRSPLTSNRDQRSPGYRGRRDGVVDGALYSKSGAVRPDERSTPSWRSQTERRRAASCLCKQRRTGSSLIEGGHVTARRVASAETSPMKGEV